MPYTLGSAFIIYVFALENGVISNLLTGKVTSYLSKISNYGFLTHMVIFRYIYAIMVRLPIDGIQNFTDKYIGWFEISIGFILTILSVEIWIKLENYIKSKINSQLKL